jgi:hypothetical protein
MVRYHDGYDRSWWILYILPLPFTGNLSNTQTTTNWSVYGVISIYNRGRCSHGMAGLACVEVAAFSLLADFNLRTWVLWKCSRQNGRVANILYSYGKCLTNFFISTDCATHV